MEQQLLPYRIALTILGVITVILNAAGLYVLFRVPFKMLSTTVFFRLLLVTGIYGGCQEALYNVLPEYLQTKSMGFNAFVCKFWYQHNLFWQALAWSAYALVFICMDRLMVMLYPVTYRRYQKETTILAVITSFLLSFLLCLPFFVRRQYDNGRCMVREVKNSAMIIVFVWSLVSFVIPLISFITTYVYILLVVIRRNRLGQNQDAPIDGFLKDDNNQASGSLKQGLKKLLLNTLVMTINFFLLNSIVVIIYSTGHLRLIPFTVHTSETGLLLALLSLANYPIIMIASTHRLRKYVTKRYSCRRRTQE